MVRESYPCYVRIGESDGSEDVIELPTEEDGTMLLSTITAQFPDAIGLKFKSDTGAWRGVRATEGVLDIPLEGWENAAEYIVTVGKKAEKRKLGDYDSGKTTKKGKVSDLIVLGLPYSTTEVELKTYFENYGTLEHCEVKHDSLTGKSRGFGFIRYTTVGEVEEVLSASHSLGGRSLEVRYPNKQGLDNSPTKLFIGRLPSGTTVDELKTCFSEYAPLKDVYIPQNFRGFGFVTFGSQGEAQEVMNGTHTIRGSVLNISIPAPKRDEQMAQGMQMESYGYGNSNMYGNMQGGMQGGMQRGMVGNMQGMPGNMQGGNMRMGQQGGSGGYGNR